LIEEFMLLANKKVAEYIGKQKKTFIYRIHDEPNEDKIAMQNHVIASLDTKLISETKAIFLNFNGG
jgi:ribonuclease R